MSTPENLREPMPQRPNPWQLLTAFHSSAPRWPGALRAALAIFLPGAAALLLGFDNVMLLIAAGGCTVIYGEGHPYRARWRVMVIAGGLLTLGTTGGAFVGSTAWEQIDTGATLWWLLVPALYCTAMATVGAFVQNALHLRPPGAFFIVMVSGGATMVARLGINPIEVGLWASIGAATGVLLGIAPALFDAHAPERRAVITLDKAVADFEAAEEPTLSQRHQAADALAAAWEALGDAGVIHAGSIAKPELTYLVTRTRESQLRLARRTAELGMNLSDTDRLTDSPSLVDPSRAAIPHTRPSNSYRIYRSLDPNSHAMITAQKVMIASLAAAVIGIAFGFTRPDWAIVSALLTLQWGPNRWSGQIRGLHRVIGSLLGIGVFAAFHLMGLSGWGLLIALAICQFGAEFFVVKNYALCVIFTTPLALLLGNSVTDPLGEVVVSRTVEVLLSVVFASLALWFWASRSDGRNHAGLVVRAFGQMGDLLGALTTTSPEGATRQRRDLQYELLSERAAILALAEADRAEAARRWDDHLLIQRTGYAMLDYCNAHNDRELSFAELASLAEALRDARKALSTKRSLPA